MSDHPGTSIGPMRITDEDLVSAGPTVRALLVARLEALFRPVQRHMDEVEAGLGVADPRLLEFGRQVVKDEATLYRLARPPVLADTGDTELPGEGVDRRALVESRLSEIEKKYQASYTDTRPP